MSKTPDSAMVLAAGLGMRMRPITERLPKPLVPVDGRPMLDYTLDHLQAAGIGNVVVNVHHLGDMLLDHLAARPDFDAVISDETDRLMDSGGGVVKALPLLGDGPFLILNGDSFWLEAPDAGETNLSRMTAAWDPRQMDMLIMTAPMDRAIGYDGRGDFLADAAGRLCRYDRHSPDPQVYAGVIMTHPGIFADAPDEPFSLNWCFDRAIAAGRLFGMPSKGLWLTVGTPEAIGEAEAAMRAFRAAEAAAEALP